MRSSTILSALASVTLAFAAAVPPNLAPRMLGPDQVLVWGFDGQVEILNKTILQSMAHGDGSFGIEDPTPLNGSIPYNSTYAGLARRLYHSASSRAPQAKTASSSSKLNKRCESNAIVTLDSNNTFLDWDVLMSRVVKGTGTSTTVAVTQGFLVANGITISRSTDISLVKDFVSTSLGIDYTQTWTSTYTSQYSFGIPEGSWGAVVSNPLTTRISGRIVTGCIGEDGEVDTWSLDSLYSQTYDSLSWVQGTISLCTGDIYPLPRCLGGGTLS